jgi:carbamoyltransferase
MVLAERASEIFEGQLPSPYMLFTHRVRPSWVDRIPAVIHVDGTARIQTIDDADEPLVARMLRQLERRTGVPVVVNTSLNTAGRPMVDDPRDALECFGSAPIDALALGPYLIRRRGLTRPTAGGDLRERASDSEPAGGDLRERASNSEPAGGDLRERASNSEPAGGEQA